MDVRLNNIMIPTDDVPASTSFYRDLGLTIRHAGDTFTWFRADSTNLMVVKAPFPVPETEQESGIFLEFAVDDLAALKASLADRGVPILREWQDGDGPSFVATRDPGGNFVHFFETR